jgi:hypothetical protein
MSPTQTVELKASATKRIAVWCLARAGFIAPYLGRKQCGNTQGLYLHIRTPLNERREELSRHGYLVANPGWKLPWG